MEISIDLENERKRLKKIGKICSFVIPLGAVGAVELIGLVKNVQPEYADIIGKGFMDFIVFNFGLGLALLTVSFTMYIIDDIHGIKFPSIFYLINRWFFFTVGITAIFYTMINSIAIHFGGKIGIGHILQIISFASIYLYFLVALSKKEKWIFIIPIFVYFLVQPFLYFSFN